MIVSAATAKPEFALRSWESQRRYAERIGVDHRVIMIQPSPRANTRKLEIMRGCGAARVVWLDWDVVVKPDAENVFEMEGDFLGFTGSIYGVNSGLLLSDQETLSRLWPCYRAILAMSPPDGHLFDEPMLNHALADAGITPRAVMPGGFVHHMGSLKFKQPIHS